MGYWLFQIMYKRFPESWRLMIERGIAAEHYPLEENWRNAKLNNKELSKIREGDFIVASFTNHRFAGYAKIISDFYVGGESLEIVDPDWEPGYKAGFHERFKCDWIVIPPERNKPFINCNELKKLGFDIDLMRGKCVKQIDERTFEALRTRLDNSGARRELPITKSNLESIVKADLDSIFAEEELFEGKKGQRYTTYYERNSKLRIEAIKIHGFKCMACEFDFEQKYGERGSKYIEVHHLNPVSSLKKETPVDPKTEMAVVCSNCHRIIHRKKNDILSLEELRKLILDQDPSKIYSL